MPGFLNGISGTYKDPDGYFVCEKNPEAFEQFEATFPIMTFGPIAIAPEYKRQGYGKKLLDYSMEKAREMGAGALAITGNILFYGRRKS